MALPTIAATFAADERTFMSVTELVSRYGAVGDGVTDDTAALQAAIDAIGDAGNVLYLPAGIYRTTSALRILNKDNVRIQGVSARLNAIAEEDGACIRNEGTGYALEVINDTGGAAVNVGIWLDGIHLRTNNGATHALRISACNKVHLTDCIVTGAQAAGAAAVSLDRVAYFSAFRCRFDDSDFGVLCENGVGDYLNNANFFQSEFQCDTAGVSVQGAQIGFHGCAFEGGITGARVSAISGGIASQGVCFDGCYWEGSTTQLLDLGSEAGVRGASIRGSYFLCNVGTPTRYARLVGNGIVVEGNAFSYSGTQPTEDMAIENSDYVRVGHCIGLTSGRITQAGNTNVTLEMAA